jgi:hypothetical protein
VAFTAHERRFVVQTPRVPIAAPAPRAFDRAQALRTFDRVTKRAYQPPDWAAAEIPPAVSREEAAFWLYAISGINASRSELLRARGGERGVDHDKARAHARTVLEQLDVTQPPSRAIIAERLAQSASPTWSGSYCEIAIAVVALVGWPALLELILDEANDAAANALAAHAAERRAAFQSHAGSMWVSTTLYVDEDGAPHAHSSQSLSAPQLPDAPQFPAPAPDTPFAALRAGAGPGFYEGLSQRAQLRHALAAGFANYVGPYLDDVSFEQARAVVRPAIRRALAQPPFAGEHYERLGSFSPACYLAASLQLTDDVEAIVASVSQEIEWARMLSFLPVILYGLRSADAVVAECRRFGLALATPRAVREFLATTGEAGIDYACEQIAAHAADETADAFVAAVAALDTASLPATILRLTTIPSLYVSARTWIEARFDGALAALAAASYGTSTLSETANEILRRFARREHPGAVAALTRKTRP